MHHSPLNCDITVLSRLLPPLPHTSPSTRTPRIGHDGGEVCQRELDMEKEHYDVLVVGAGVVGCATAYYVAKAGLQVALLDKGRIAGEASQAGAGMLVPLAESDGVSDQHPFAQLCLAGLQFYNDLDQQLKSETGIDIELVDVPTLRPAFDEH